MALTEEDGEHHNVTMRRESIQATKKMAKLLGVPDPTGKFTPYGQKKEPLFKSRILIDEAHSHNERDEKEKYTRSQVAAMIEQAMHDLQRSVDRPFVGQQVAERVARKHGFTLSDLRSNRRNSRLVKARHEAMFRVYTETGSSLNQVGSVLGGKDHSSVLNGIRQHCKRKGIPYAKSIPAQGQISRVDSGKAPPSPWLPGARSRTMGAVGSHRRR